MPFTVDENKVEIIELNFIRINNKSVFVGTFINRLYTIIIRLLKKETVYWRRGEKIFSFKILQCMYNMPLITYV